MVLSRRWMGAESASHHGLKRFKFQTDNGEFNNKACRDLVAASVKVLITNCPYAPETMSIIRRSWRTIGVMATVMLLRCWLTKNFWEEAIAYAVDIYNRVPPAKANHAGLRQSPFEKLHRESLDELRPYGCRG